MTADVDYAFGARVDEWVASALSSRELNFPELLTVLPGVFPETVLHSVSRLGARGFLSEQLVQQIKYQATQSIPRSPEVPSALPVPHPLNFEWRFAHDTCRMLLERADSTARADASLLLFGTPSLAVEAMSSVLRRPVSFLGEENAVTRRVSDLNAHARKPLNLTICSKGLPRNSAGAVILDPPWYIDYFRPMLSAAAAACEANGVVLASLPPIGARPTASADRALIVRFARRLGLELIEERASAIQYDTPFFEKNVLAAKGIFVPLRWRSGDLFVFRKVRESSVSPPAKGGSRATTWKEVSVGRMRLFVRCDNPRPSGMRGIIPLVDGDILQSVSRRDPRRLSAHLWTSGNRVFATDNIDLVLEAARACRSNGKPIVEQSRCFTRSYIHGSDIDRVADELSRLADLEGVEEEG